MYGPLSTSEIRSEIDSDPRWSAYEPLVDSVERHCVAVSPRDEIVLIGGITDGEKTDKAYLFDTQGGER